MFKVDFYLLKNDENASFTLEVDSAELYYQKRGSSAVKRPFEGVLMLTQFNTGYNFDTSIKEMLNTPFEKIILFNYDTNENVEITKDSSYFCDSISIRQKTDGQTGVSSINTHFSFKEMIQTSDLT